MEYLLRLKEMVTIEPILKTYIIEEVSLLELMGYLNILSIVLPEDETEKKEAMMKLFIPAILKENDHESLKEISNILTYKELIEIINRFNSLNGILNILNKTEDGDKKTKENLVSWSEICFDLAGQFGTTPDEIAQRFSMRQIERFYEIYCQRHGDELKFQAQIHGINIDNKPEKEKPKNIISSKDIKKGEKINL